MVSDITAKLKAIRPEHINAAIEEIERNGFPSAHSSKHHYLRYDGKDYPQKYIVSLATRYVSGKQLAPTHFHAGQSRKILESLGFEVFSTQSPPDNSKRENISGEMISELYYFSKELYEKRIARIDIFEELKHLKPATVGAYLDDFPHLREGTVYQRTMNAEATDYFLDNIHQDYGVSGLQMALEAVDKHLQYYDSLGKGSQRKIHEVWEKYSVIAGNDPERHKIDGSYTGQSSSFRAKPTKTPIDLTRFNTMPDSPLSKRDSDFLSDIWERYGMDCFERKNMDAGNIRRVLERGFIEYVSGDSATPQCKFQLTYKAQSLLESTDSLLFNELGVQNSHIEGGTGEAIRSYYKRNPRARADCLAHHGYSCVVCGFDFEKTYGAIGRRFIHVHHENEMALNGSKEYIIDAINDLKPVCPNCHAMIHQRKPAFSIQEFREKYLLKK